MSGTTWATEWEGLRVEVEENERGEMVSLSVRSAVDGDPVSPGLASRMPLSRLVREEQERRAEQEKTTRFAGAGSIFSRGGVWGSEYLDAFKEDRRGSRVPRTELDWARLAVAYEWAYVFHDAQDIVRMWVEEFGSTRTTWNNRTSYARRLGFLTADGMATRAALDLVGLSRSPHEEVEEWGRSDLAEERWQKVVEDLRRWERGELDDVDRKAIDEEEKRDRQRVVVRGGRRVPRARIVAAYLDKKKAETRRELGLLPERDA